MSGKPNPPDTQRVLEIVNRTETLRAEATELNKTIRDAQARLKPLEEEYAALFSEFDTLIRAMDLASPGNYGYERRMAWFLGEVHRQGSRSGRRENLPKVLGAVSDRVEAGVVALWRRWSAVVGHATMAARRR